MRRLTTRIDGITHYEGRWEECLDKLAYFEDIEEDEFELEAGTEVWVVERDEDGVACDVTGYIFLAKVGDYVITTAYINGRNDLEYILNHHAEETAQSYNTDLEVFPLEDCYTTQDAAHAAQNEEEENDETNT